MLKELCEYYDLLRSRGESGLVEEGYSSVPITFDLVLNEDGTICEILSYRQQQLVGKKSSSFPPRSDSPSATRSPALRRKPSTTEKNISSDSIGTRLCNRCASPKIPPSHLKSAKKSISPF